MSRISTLERVRPQDFSLSHRVNYEAAALTTRPPQPDKTHLTLFTSTELAKKEDIVSASTYNLAKMERKASLKKEPNKEDQKINYKEAIENCKSQLETGYANKRNMLHLLNKMAADVRKVRREIENINAQKENIR